MSARATRGSLDYNLIIEQNPNVRDGSPIVLIPRSTQLPLSMPSRDLNMQSTQRRRLQPSATPGINVIRDIDQDPARLLVFVVSGFILRHLLRCGRCRFTTQVFTSHARHMLWRFAGVHIQHRDLDGLIFRLEHATQTLGYNVAAVTPFDRRFCAVWRPTRGLLLDPPKPGFEAFYQGGETWPDLSSRWEDLSKDIAASEDGRGFNIAALNKALDSRLHECHYSRLPPPLLDAPTYSGYRQIPPLQNQVNLPLQNHTQAILHVLPTPPSTSSEDPEPTSQNARRRQPSRPARRRAHSAMARAAIAEADLTEREDSEDRRLVEEDEAVSSIERSPQKSQTTVKRKRGDARHPEAAAVPGQGSVAGPSASNNQPTSPSQGSEGQKPPRKRYKNKARRNFYVPSPEPPSRFVPNYDPTPPLEQTESEPRPKDAIPKVEPEDSLDVRPSGSGVAFAEANSDADVIARLTREFAANVGDHEFPPNTVEIVVDQFGFTTGGRDPPEIETVEEIVNSTRRDFEAQRRAEAEARQAQAQIQAEAAAAASQARKKEAEARAKAAQDAREKEAAEVAAAIARAKEREKRRRDVLEVPAVRAIREAQAQLEEKGRRIVAAKEEWKKRQAEVKAKAKAERDAEAQAEAAKAARASNAAVQQQTPSDSNCDSDFDCSDSDSDSGDSVSDESSCADSCSGESLSDESSSDESSSEESACDESSSEEFDNQESSSNETSSEESSSDETASLTSTPERTQIVLRLDNGTFDREVLQMRLEVTRSGVRQDQNLLEELTRSEQRRR